MLRWSSSAAMLSELTRAHAGEPTSLGDEVQMAIDGLDDASIAVTALRGTEGVNTLYQFDVLATVRGVPEAQLHSNALGRMAHLKLLRPDGAARAIHGVIARAQLLHASRGEAGYHFHIVPKLWLASKTVDSRVFSHLTVQQVATEILREHGVVHAWSLARQYERREYVVQYEESDYDFLLRILAEVGIFFGFEHPHDADALREILAQGLPNAIGGEVAGLAQQGLSLDNALGAAQRVAGQVSSWLQVAELQGVGEVLVLGDTASSYSRLSGVEELVYDPTLSAAAMRSHQNHVEHFHVSSQVEATRATVREYNHERAQVRPHGTVLSTFPEGYQGALANVVSLAANEANQVAGEVNSQLGAASGAFGAVGQAAGTNVAEPGHHLGRLNENHSFGVVTASHAEMAPEVALARSAVAMAGEIGDALLAQTDLSGMAGQAADVGVGAIGATELEVYEHHGEYEEPEASFALAATRLEQLRTHRVVAGGSSHCRLLSPMHVVTLRGHNVPSFNRRYVIIEVTHELFADPAGAAIYQNEFECIADNVPARPHPPHRKVIQSSESGVVVGADGQHISTEHLGKVKVQFHWDRRRKHDQHSSCWIRVAQAWSGAQFGFQFIPRIGMEVLVSFIGGDPNRPVVSGCLPNLAQQPPYHLPEHKTRSGIRTNSVPEGGYNELFFEDRSGEELVSMRAERDHAIDVQHDQRIAVAHDRELSVGGDQQVNVAHDHTRTVGGDEVHSVAGTLHQTVAAEATHTFGRRSTRVTGDELLRVEGGQTIIADGYMHTIVRPSPGGDAAAYNLSVDGNSELTASGGIIVSGSRSLQLQAGSSSIHLSEDGIVLRASKIQLHVTDECEVFVGDERKLIVSDNTELSGSEILLASSGGSLKLDADAHLDGGRVLLNCGGAEPEDGSADNASEQRQVRFRVTLPEGTSGEVVFVISEPDGSVNEHNAPGGELTLEGRPGSRYTLLDVRVDGHSLGLRPPDEEES